MTNPLATPSPPPSVDLQTQRQDLENLYESLTQGWSQYDCGIDRDPPEEHGAGGGCLTMQMARVSGFHGARGEAINLVATSRYRAMIANLGFVNGGEIMRWNDAIERTWDETKERVKDAIGKL